MLRAIEAWELKYYKFAIDKRFKFFKWEISFNICILNSKLNSKLHEEWKKRIENIIDKSITVSSSQHIDCYDKEGNIINKEE